MNFVRAPALLLEISPSHRRLVKRLATKGETEISRHTKRQHFNNERGRGIVSLERHWPLWPRDLTRFLDRNGRRKLKKFVRANFGKPRLRTWRILRLSPEIGVKLHLTPLFHIFALKAHSPRATPGYYGVCWRKMKSSFPALRQSFPIPTHVISPHSLDSMARAEYDIARLISTATPRLFKMPSLSSSDLRPPTPLDRPLSHPLALKEDRSRRT